jgi:uncharacterized SAM-binding protein YcdF (DUF218 family)
MEGSMVAWPDLPEHGGRRSVPRPSLPRAFAVLLGIGAVTGVVFLVGFVLFVQKLARIEPPAAPQADGIVALTGGSERISDAMALLSKGHARRVLITGVNEKTSREEIARQQPDLKPLFACCVDLDYRALNTIGNAWQTREWAQQQGFRSLLVVTASYHMPRSLAELRHVMPGIDLVPHPVVPDRLDLDRWWRDPATVKLLAIEYVKYVVALARMQVETRPSEIRVGGAIGPSASLHKP